MAMAIALVGIIIFERNKCIYVTFLTTCSVMVCAAALFALFLPGERSVSLQHALPRRKKFPKYKNKIFSFYFSLFISAISLTFPPFLPIRQYHHNVNHGQTNSSSPTALARLILTRNNRSPQTLPQPTRPLPVHPSLPLLVRPLHPLHVHLDERRTPRMGQNLQKIPPSKGHTRRQGRNLAPRIVREIRSPHPPNASTLVCLPERCRSGPDVYTFRHPLRRRSKLGANSTRDDEFSSLETSWAECSE